MTRIVSYNILAGGYSLRENGARRSKQLTQIIRSVEPDVVGLAEAIHPQMLGTPLVVEEVAEALNMQLIKGGDVTRGRDYQIALLTCLPVVDVKVHTRPGILLRPLLEVCVEEESGEQLTVFMTHLSAAFNQGRAGGQIRMREMREILRVMAPLREAGKPHILMGDFNSLAPHEAFKASALLRYVVKLDQNIPAKAMNDGNPHLASVVPPRLSFLHPLLKVIAGNKLLCTLFDAAAYFYAPRGCIRLVYEAGYVDTYRRDHPEEEGFTCPAAAPAGRIDYIFASPVLAERLEKSAVIVGVEGLPGSHASDHLAVVAEFGIGVPTISMPPIEIDSAITLP